jgi:hypothetical protein
MIVSLMRWVAQHRNSKTAALACTSLQVLWDGFSWNAVTLINSIITNLLVAFYGAFFMSVFYSEHCYAGECSWSAAAISLEPPSISIRADQPASFGLPPESFGAARTMLP